MADHEADPDVGAIREELGLTQSGLADLLGVSLRTVQSCEQGWRQPGAMLEKVLLMHLMIRRRGSGLTDALCWKHVGCSEDARERCPVFQSRLGYLCWMLSGNICCSDGERVEDWETKKEVCRECGFFAALLTPGK